MKRTLLVITVALAMVTIMVFMVAPAFAAQRCAGQTATRFAGPEAGQLASGAVHLFGGRVVGTAVGENASLDTCPPLPFP